MDDERRTDNPYKFFHSTCAKVRDRIHVVIVEPESSGNVGSICRALANMDIRSPLRIVGKGPFIDGESEKMAKHAKDRLLKAELFPSLSAALECPPNEPKLALASTARIGSPHRPHPLWAREAMQRAMGKLVVEEVAHLFLVFGRESSGLTNEEVALCDWVVTIPSSHDYRSLNLAQSVLVFAYEANLFLTEQWSEFESAKPSQKNKLVAHLMQLAEDVGFVLPGDPQKMRPRLEVILGHLPNHIRYVKTLHGLIDQIRRSVRKGAPDLKGRFRHDRPDPHDQQELN